MKRVPIYMGDNTTFKWENDGKQYCLHICEEDYPENPRRWDNLTLMACWHRNYSLGDEVDDKTPEEFWQRLVRQNVSSDKIFEAAVAGELEGIRLAESEEEPGSYDIYETCYLAGFQTSKEAKEYLEYSEVAKGYVVDYLLDDLAISHCQQLLEPYVEWLPLWLYDHGGITMSCGSRSYPYNDRWDSGQVGWIVAMKEKIMAETLQYVLDENGERIREEHKHENAPSTWSYKAVPLTDETWRGRAIEIMQSEVETYDQYLRGDVYGYHLYRSEDDDWVEEDACWGFFGDDIIDSGISGEVGYGLTEALLSGNYEKGKAAIHNCTYYTF